MGWKTKNADKIFINVLDRQELAWYDCWSHYILMKCKNSFNLLCLQRTGSGARSYWMLAIVSLFLWFSLRYVECNVFVTFFLLQVLTVFQYYIMVLELVTTCGESWCFYRKCVAEAGGQIREILSSVSQMRVGHFPHQIKNNQVSLFQIFRAVK